MSALMSIATRAILSLLGVALLIGCNSSSRKPSDTTPLDRASITAESLLRRSMDVYAEMPTFTAMTRLSVDTGYGKRLIQTRSITLETPRHFRVVATNRDRSTIVSASDGDVLTEFNSADARSGQRVPAPDSIGDAGTIQLRNPLLCGSLLYSFFGGAHRMSDLVNGTSGSVELGKEDITPSGESGRHVVFHASGGYGSVDVLIGVTSCLVYRIRFDGGELFADANARSNLARLLGLPKDMKSLQFEEEIVEQHTRQKLPAGSLSVHIPPQIHIVDSVATLPKGAPSPVMLGSELPDATVVTLDGKDLNLRSLRGAPTLLAFWATQSPDSVSTLTDCTKLVAKFPGVRLVAITSEEKEAVTQFAMPRGRSFTVAIDRSGNAFDQCRVSSLPSVLAYDRTGKLVLYRQSEDRSGDLASTVSKLAKQP